MNHELLAVGLAQPFPGKGALVLCADRLQHAIALLGAAWPKTQLQGCFPHDLRRRAADHLTVGLIDPDQAPGLHFADGNCEGAGIEDRLEQGVGLLLSLAGQIGRGFVLVVGEEQLFAFPFIFAAEDPDMDRLTIEPGQLEARGLQAAARIQVLDPCHAFVKPRLGGLVWAEVAEVSAREFVRTCIAEQLGSRRIGLPDQTGLVDEDGVRGRFEQRCPPGLPWRLRPRAQAQTRPGRQTVPHPQERRGHASGGAHQALTAVSCPQV